MSLEYSVSFDFFGLETELLNDDCGHRTGFEYLDSRLLKHNPDDPPVARVHELECMTCGHVWLAAMKSQ